MRKFHGHMIDEESDDDSYWDQFDQSENEVDATDHRQDEVSSEPAGDYFDIMEQQCLIREETVAGENDIVWKRVLQSEERGWIKSTQALKCVESELKDTVPHSIMVHTELKNILSGKFDDFYELWVDKVNDPELIMLFTESWEFCGSTIHLFGDPGVCSKKLTTLMFNVVRDFEAKHPDRSQQFALECVDQGIAEEFISLLERKERKVLQVVYAGTFASPYARPTPDCHCIAPIDTNRYKIDSVKVEDAELINSTWKYRGDTSLREVCCPSSPLCVLIVGYRYAK